MGYPERTGRKTALQRLNAMDPMLIVVQQSAYLQLEARLISILRSWANTHRRQLPKVANPSTPKKSSSSTSWRMSLTTLKVGQFPAASQTLVPSQTFSNQT